MFSKQLCKVTAPQLFNLKWKVEGPFVWGWDQNENMYAPSKIKPPLPKVVSPLQKGLLHGPYNERYCNSFQTTINEAGLCYTFNNYNLGTKGRVAKFVEFQDRHLNAMNLYINV